MTLLSVEHDFCCVLPSSSESVIRSTNFECSQERSYSGFEGVVSFYRLLDIVNMYLAVAVIYRDMW